MKREKNNKMSSADVFSVITLVVIAITLGITIPIHIKYPETFSTNWVIVICFALISPFLLFNGKIQLEEKRNFTDEQKNNAFKKIGKIILTIWYLDFTYVCLFKNWLFLFFVLAGLYFIRMVFNVSKVAINAELTVPFLNFFIVGDFTLAVLLLILLIYKLPDEKLQTIVISISAAITGGLLTLIGVLMTIKKSDKDKKEERQLQIKPFFFYTPYYNGPDYEFGKKSIHIKKFGTITKNEKTIGLGRFVNSDKVEFYIKSIIINNQEILISNYDFTVSKGELFLIALVTNKKAKTPDSYILKTNDIDGNELLWEITLDIDVDENIPTNIELIK